MSYQPGDPANAPTTPAAPAPGQPAAAGAPAHPYNPAAPAQPVATTSSYGGMAARILVTLIGAAAMIVSAFLDWISTRSGVDLGISVLWHTNLHTGRYFFTTVGFAAIALGLVAIVGLAPRTGVVTRLAGVLGIVLFVLFVITVYRAPGNFDIGALKIGPWVLLVGSVIALVGGLIGSRPPAWQAGSGGYAPA